MMERLGADFFHRDCLEVAPDLVGKLLIRQLPDGTILQERIAETETDALAETDWNTEDWEY